MVDKIICSEICFTKLFIRTGCPKATAANFGTNTAAKANGIYICLANSKCVPSLHAASLILEILESLNNSLQSSFVHVDGMMNSVRLSKSKLINLHITKKFTDIFKEAQKMSDDLGLEDINFSRKRKTPIRCQGSELAEQSYSNAEDYYRGQFIQRLMLLWPVCMTTLTLQI